MGRMGYDDQQLAAHKKRTSVSAIMIFILMPLTLWASVTLLDSSKYMITSLLVVIYTMVPFFMIYEKRRPKAREIVLLAVMTAIVVFAHIAFHLAAVPIGTALVIVAGISQKYRCASRRKSYLFPVQGAVYAVADVLLGAVRFPRWACF